MIRGDGRTCCTGGQDPRQLPPGGANVGFFEGSVRFVKESIPSVPFDPEAGDVPAFPRDRATGVYAIAPGARPGDWRQPSTRGLGEVGGGDAF